MASWRHTCLAAVFCMVSNSGFRKAGWSKISRLLYTYHYRRKPFRKLDTMDSKIRIVYHGKGEDQEIPPKYESESAGQKRIALQLSVLGSNREYGPNIWGIPHTATNIHIAVRICWSGQHDQRQNCVLDGKFRTQRIVVGRTEACTYCRYL